MQLSCFSLKVKIKMEGERERERTGHVLRKGTIESSVPLKAPKKLGKKNDVRDKQK